MYIEYEAKRYRIISDLSDMTNPTSKSLKAIYEITGNEGRDLGELLNDEQYDGWTILYDYGNGKYEAVSPEAMRKEGDTEGLRLGYSETATDDATKTEEAIVSYNNAITTINNYCKEVERLPKNVGVRSVGAKTETTEMYSEIPSDWAASVYNGKVKQGDIEYLLDYSLMQQYGVASTGEVYWIASRRIIISDNYDQVNFDFRTVWSNAGLDCGEIWCVYSNGSASGFRSSNPVRPIITVQAR